MSRCDFSTVKLRASKPGKGKRERESGSDWLGQDEMEQDEAHTEILRWQVNMGRQMLR
jgi:hypothetical protein